MLDTTADRGGESGGTASMSATTEDEAGIRRAGRRPVTSRFEIEHIALEMFSERGFDATTVDDVAHAAGIGRRTFFRYYASKNDVPWGAFDEQLLGMRATFARLPPDIPILQGIRSAVLDFNHVDPPEQPWHRRRLQLILNTPTLQAHSTLRYAAWRQVVADYVALRLAEPAGGLIPQSVGHACLGVCIAAYERWLADDGSDLRTLLGEVFASLERGWGASGLG